MIWVLLLITIGQQSPIGEYKTKEACMVDVAEYTKTAFRDEVFVCRRMRKDYEHSKEGKDNRGRRGKE